MIKFVSTSLILFVTICNGADWSFNTGLTSSINDLSRSELDYLNSIKENDLKEILEYVTESVEKQKRFEENLINSQIIVRNGSLSHAQLLDTLPNAQAKTDSKTAFKIMKASQYFYNAKCAPMGISAERCAIYLAEKNLPTNTLLQQECVNIVKNRRDGHHPFRRLLPKKFRDGLYNMYSELNLPSPLLISNQALHGDASAASVQHDRTKNLAIVQWSQFIEHDLSKPVVTSMRNGAPIECCNNDNYKLEPRFHHSECAALLEKTTKNKYGRVNCLNYVRSALALGDKCTFGAVEQLNQATGTLDLSQLYGFTINAQNNMRSFHNGQIKHSNASLPKQQLLPLASENSHLFCALASDANDSTCFMAGDSRVNSNPFTILLYTIFLRNHNRIALKLKQQNSQWKDDKIFKAAKTININTYRQIVFNEWLPAVLGSHYTQSTITATNEIPKVLNQETHISNEFAVAAIRFYYSMMPNSLQDNTEFVPINQNPNPSQTSKSPSVANPPIFVLKNEIFKPHLEYSREKLNEILESLLNQRAMKMDSTYVESLISNILTGRRPTHSDILAFDIQRGRDHGLQGYVEYVKACNGLNINSWTDLEKFISKADVAKIQSVYTNLSDIDLIVGGIAEIPVNDSTVGPTFSCILAEQFAKIRLWQQNQKDASGISLNTEIYTSLTATDLLCINSDLQFVQKNIFKLPSKQNPLIACAERT